ncbi:chorismate synthase [Lentisphaerota bacterium WC36G]|nr:chorismate synthase [Lentisphaerae bacterium WC36]
MSGSVFGKEFTISTFGESHGGAVGVIVDGVTPNIEISAENIQKELNKRRPGQSKITTQRDERDMVKILSGVYEGRTTGVPIMLVVFNKDAKSNAYDNIKDLFRPGHADYAYLQKYGIRDHRGSGRASGRETIGRVAAGAIAKKILKEKYNIDITAYVVNVAGIKAQKIDYSEIENNIVRVADKDVAEEIVAKITELMKQHDSTGGIIECNITGVMPGIGEPTFDKLDADLAKAMLSIGAVKGIEFGAGFGVAEMSGSENNDWMDEGGFQTNNAGGIIGGISTGQDIVFRVPVKPTSSIAKPQPTVDINGEEVVCETFGRHDPIIAPRAVPVVEAMAAIVILDHIKRQKALHA